jgi:hypothetical protein
MHGRTCCLKISMHTCLASSDLSNILLQNVQSWCWSDSKAIHSSSLWVWVIFWVIIHPHLHSFFISDVSFSFSKEIIEIEFKHLLPSQECPKILRLDSLLLLFTTLFMNNLAQECPKVLMQIVWIVFLDFTFWSIFILWKQFSMGKKVKPKHNQHHLHKDLRALLSQIFHKQCWE